MSELNIVISALIVLLALVLVGLRTDFFARFSDPVLRERRRVGFDDQSVLVQGVRCAFLEGNKGKRPSVVLLHGFASVKEDWSHLAVRLLEAGYHVVAPDLPGFGESQEDPSTKSDVTAFARWLRAFAQATRLQRFHLVGCSLGATVAASYACVSPVEVLSLVLIEPLGLRVPYESELEKQLARGNNPMVVRSPEEYERHLAFLFATPPTMTPSQRQQRAASAVATSVLQTEVWRAIREGERPYILDLLLPELKSPTLVISGADSRVVHRATGELIGKIVHGTEEVRIPDAGHLVMVEQPQKTAEAVLRFLGTSRA